MLQYFIITTRDESSRPVKTMYFRGGFDEQEWDERVSYARRFDSKKDAFAEMEDRAVQGVSYQIQKIYKTR